MIEISAKQLLWKNVFSNTVMLCAKYNNGKSIMIFQLIYKHCEKYKKYN